VWEIEGSLSARWLTSLVPVKRCDYVAKSDLRKNFAKDHLTILKVFENKYGHNEEKSFDFVLCLFGFVKATKLRGSSEYADCGKNV